MRCSNFTSNRSSTSETYTLSLHDALPIFFPAPARFHRRLPDFAQHVVPFDELAERGVVPVEKLGIPQADEKLAARDRKSTRLNSSHTVISDAVVCLKKKIKRLLLHGSYGA